MNKQRRIGKQIDNKQLLELRIQEYEMKKQQSKHFIDCSLVRGITGLKWRAHS